MPSYIWQEFLRLADPKSFSLIFGMIAVEKLAFRERIKDFFKHDLINIAWYFVGIRFITLCLPDFFRASRAFWHGLGCDLHLPMFLGGRVTQFLAFLIVWEFIHYWAHRAMHTKWLWWIHRLHHEDRYFDASTTVRLHWGEILLSAIVLAIPHGLFVNFALGPTLMDFLFAYNLFVHYRWPVEMGWLKPFFLGPREHLIHHSIEPKHYGKNMGVIFPFFDKMFGTYYAPAKNETPNTGVCPEELIQNHEIREPTLSV